MSESAAPPPEHPPHLRRPKRRWWLSLVMGVVLLISGFVMGISVTVVFLYNRVIDALHHPEDVPAKLVERMQWRYDIDEEDSQELLRIFTNVQEELVRLRDRDYPYVSGLLDQAKADAIVLLEEEDRETFSERWDHARDLLVVPPASRGAAE